MDRIIDPDFVREMHKNRLPDFIGKFKELNATLNIPGFFKMYIDKKGIDKKLIPPEGIEDISGIILDCFGAAAFEGHITSDEIVFRKEYTPTAIENGGNERAVKYRGKRLKIPINLETFAYRGIYSLPSGAQLSFEIEAY